MSESLEDTVSPNYYISMSLQSGLVPSVLKEVGWKSNLLGMTLIVSQASIKVEIL